MKNNNKNIIHIPLSWNISINQANKSDTNLIIPKVGDVFKDSYSNKEYTINSLKYM